MCFCACGEKKVCPYGDAHQRDKGNAYGGSRLGKWKRVADAPSSVVAPAYADLSLGSSSSSSSSSSSRLQAFYFENGDWCGASSQARTATVSLVCGGEDALLLVEEPSVCEYTFVLATPAACELALGHSLRLDLPDKDDDDQDDDKDGTGAATDEADASSDNRGSAMHSGEL